MNARPLIVLTLQQYVPMFFVRNHPGDWDHAMVLLDQTIQAAQELGMDELERRALAIKSRNQDRPAETAVQAAPRVRPRLALIKGKEEHRPTPTPTTKHGRTRAGES